MSKHEKRRFLSKVLPKIWKKCGFPSIWAIEYHCKKDGSMLYSLKGFLFCHVCGFCPGYSSNHENSDVWEKAPLNSPGSHNGSA